MHEHCGQKGFKTISDLFILRVFLFFYVECASYKTNAVFHDIEFCAYCVRNHFMPPDFLCRRTQSEEPEPAGTLPQSRLTLSGFVPNSATLSITLSGLELTFHE